MANESNGHRELSRDELIKLLPGAKREGSWWMGWCPAHENTNTRALGIGPKGGIKCFSGCKASDVVKALVAQQPDHETRRNEDRAPRRMGEPEVVYEYRDVNGKAVGYKARFVSPDGKTFLWRLPDAEGYKGGLGGLPIEQVPLWNIDEVVATPGRVWFVEGEKAADALRRQGENATTGPWGSGQKSFGEAFEPLRGRRVILWPDNDDVGRSYMDHVRSHLLDTGICDKSSLFVVSPGGAAKADAYDYFAAGGNAEDLLSSQLVEPKVEVLAHDNIRVSLPHGGRTAVFDFREILRVGRDIQTDLAVSVGNRDPYEQEINVQSLSTRESLIRMLDKIFPIEGAKWAPALNQAYSLMREAWTEIQASEVQLVLGDQEPTPINMVLDPYVVEDGSTLLFGLPGKGKSWTALLMAVSVDSGHERMWKIPRPRKTMFLNLERPHNSFSRRLAAVNRSLGLEATRGLLALNGRGKTLTQVLPAVKHAIKEHGVEVIVLDSMSRAGAGDLNDNRTGNRIMDMLNSLGVTWIAIAHSPRGDDTHVYGTIMQDAAIDVSVAVRSEVHRDELGISLEMTKANDMPHAKPETWTFLMGESGLDGVRRPYTGEHPDLEKVGKSRKDLVWEYLAKEGKAPAKDIADATGIDPRHMNTVLKAGQGRYFLKLPREGKTVPWTIIKQEDGPDIGQPTFAEQGADMCQVTGCFNEMSKATNDGRELCAEHFATYSGS